MNPLSRRDFLSTAVGATAGLTLPISLEWTAEQSETRVKVPQSLPEKLKSTAKHGISMRTHEAHLTLWQGYANKTNEIRDLLANHAKVVNAPNQIASEMRFLKANYPFAFGGYINHEIYFDSMGGDNAQPSGRLLQMIENSYSSLAKWQEDFAATGMAARGWVFMAQDLGSGRVINLLGDSQDTFPLWNHVPLLAMDVYEHAYYLDFQTDRAAYIQAFLKCIDWQAAARRVR